MTLSQLRANIAAVPEAAALDSCSVAVIWPMLGPYHSARLKGASQLFRRFGKRLIAIETASREATYPWEPIDTGDSFERVTLFPGAMRSEFHPNQIKAAVARALDAANPDAVAVCGWRRPETQQAIRWCRARGRIVVLMSASKEDDAPRAVHREYAKRRIVQLCDSALVGGTPQKEYTVRLGTPEGCVFVGYDSVGNELFSSVADSLQAADVDRRALGLGTGPFFLASNRFIRRKNLDRLIQAYERYRADAKSPWDLVLLGDGPERPVIERLVAESGVEGVRFPGFRQIDELPLYYALANCFVHPALQDQWGLVVNEAMAAGLPVLVSRAAGCSRDLVHEGENGFTFDPAEVMSITGLMLRIHQLPDEQLIKMRQASRQIISNWGTERFAMGLWQAVEAGKTAAEKRTRGLSVFDRILLHMI